MANDAWMLNRQEEPLDERRLERMAEGDSGSVSIYAATSMAQELLRRRTENAAMREALEAIVAAPLEEGEYIETLGDAYYTGDCKQCPKTRAIAQAALEGIG